MIFFFSMDDSETERDDQPAAVTVAPSKKKCLFDDSIVGKVKILKQNYFSGAA